MLPSTDDLQEWECCGNTPGRVPAKQIEMQIYSTVLPLLCSKLEDTFGLFFLLNS